MRIKLHDLHKNHGITNPYVTKFGVIRFQRLTTEDCPLKSLSIVGGGEALGIATVTSYMAGTNERM